MHRLLGLDRPRDERGSVLPMTVLLVVVLLGFTAFAVDLGLQRVASRDMQALADVVALDTARSLPSCDAGALTTKANASLARQDARIGREAPLVVTPGHLDATQEFVAGTGTSGCDAVRITAATTIDYTFAPVIGTEQGTSTRAAVGAKAPPAICFSAGTKALVLDSTGSVLGPVLDQVLRVNLGVVGYSGLVDLKDASVPLAGLTAALGVGTASELVGLSNLSLNRFMLATATVLRNQGDVARAVVLETIAAQVGNATLNVGRILGVDTTGTSALKADVNALDLVGAAIVAANGTNAIRVNNLGLNLGILANANAEAVVIEPPQIACGRTGATARTAQVRVDLKGSLVNVAGLLVGTQVSLSVNVASGTATLGAMTCGGTAAPTAAVSATTAVAGVGGYRGSGHAEVTGVKLDLGLLGGITVVNVWLKGGVGAVSHAPYTFTYPMPTGLPPTHTFGSPVSLALELDKVVLLSLLDVTGLYRTTVAPVVTGVSNAVASLTSALLPLLGVKLGAMDVTMLGRPSCQAVRLAG